MSTSDPLRDHLLKILDWHDAHTSFDDAIEGIPVALRGRRPAKVPYSPWQLLEHLRLCQFDILDFCRNPAYEERKWPEEYWPAGVAPPSSRSWARSVKSFREDREELKRLVADPSRDLFARIPNGTGQTYLREILLVADHNAYHVGQLVVVRRLLGAWK